MAKSQIITQVIARFYNHNSAPTVSQLVFNGERIENGVEVNDDFYVIAKEASEKVTKNSYVFNFSPDSLMRYKKMGIQKDVFFALRCANDNRFCTISLDDVLELQDRRNDSLGFDDNNQLLINVEPKNKRSVGIYVSGGGKQNPIGKIERWTGLFPLEVRNLLKK